MSYGLVEGLQQVIMFLADGKWSVDGIRIGVAGCVGIFDLDGKCPRMVCRQHCWHDDGTGIGV